MWRKIGLVVAVIIGWGVILAYIIFASHLAQQHRAEQRVEKVEIVLPNVEKGRFATKEQIRRHLDYLHIRTEGELIDSVDLTRIEECLSKEGFVKGVDSYVTSSGKLYIDIHQHEPILRLMCGGLNVYVTKERDVFCPPRGSACYTSVITGSYKPHFGRGYEGNAEVYFDKLLGDKDDEIFGIENELATVNSKRRKSDDEVELADLDRREMQLKEQQLLAEKSKKNLLKKRTDFVNLINFVSRVESDNFWSAEISQFVADTTYMGEITLRMIPRSGNFEIEFGTLDNSAGKLAKLQKFYDKGLPYVGWERYKLVDVRYDKQIICKE
ncbi:MAG: hypothetical protein IKL20_04905 [Alistipes sp.]|nr:hypothetical protein [Alistipes sp.]